MADREQISPEAARALLVKRGVITQEQADQYNQKEDQPAPQSDEESIGQFLQRKLLTPRETKFGLPAGTVNMAQDVAGGLMGGAQRLAAILGEGGQDIASILTGGYAPRVNMREEMGLEGDNQVDLKKMISHDPDSFASSVGQDLPAIIAGGASIPGQMVSQGLWGAIQADPNQENLGGYLPSGRTGAAIEDAGLTGILGKAGEEVIAGLPTTKKLLSPIKKGIDYFRPDKDAKQYLGQLGKKLTKEQNTQALASDIQKAHDVHMEDALGDKKEVMDQAGKNKLYARPDSELPEGNLDKITSKLSGKPGREGLEPDEVEGVGKAIKNFDKHGDVNRTVDKIEDVLGKDLSDSNVDWLEDVLYMDKETDTPFLNMTKNKSDLFAGDSEDAYNKFLKNKTFKNADNLQSTMNEEIMDMEKARKAGTLTRADGKVLTQLSKSRKQLLDDMEKMLERRDPKLADKYKQFRQKYRDNVAKYYDENATKEITREGKFTRAKREENPDLPYNVTSSELDRIFREPSRAALDIAKDIGPEGQRKILFNALVSDNPAKAEGLANAIKAAKNTKGYGRYVTPEMENLADQLLKRVKWRNRVNLVGKGALGGIGAVGSYETGKKLITGSF